jgi:hypothetical protein
MPFTSHARLADALLPALSEAASTILQIRDKGLVVEHKSDDSPVTEADRRAEAILSAALHWAAHIFCLIRWTARAITRRVATNLRSMSASSPMAARFSD